MPILSPFSSPFLSYHHSPIPIEGVEWHDSFIAATQNCIEKLKIGEQPHLDGHAGKKVLQFTLTALQSSDQRCEVRPDEVL